MLSLNGTILDATALIDFRWLNEWEWLKKHYSPLYIAQEILDSDNLEPVTRQAAREHLKPLRTTQHKTAREVITMADTLIEKRGKHIAPRVLADWKKSLQQ